MDSGMRADDEGRRNPVRWIMAGITLGVAVNVHALQENYSVGYRGLYTDNVFLTDKNEQDDWINSALGTLTLQQQGSRLAANIDTAVEYHDYQKDTRSDDVFGRLNARGTWIMRPGSLNWQVEDYFRQTPVTTTNPLQPDNSQYINALFTGPDVTFRFNRAYSLLSQARYAHTYYQKRKLDNDRLMAAMRLMRGTEGAPVVNSLNVEAETVDYQDRINEDFDRFDAYWRGEINRQADNVVVELGGTKIQRDTNRDITEPLLRTSWRHNISLNEYFQLRATAENSDAGIYFGRISRLQSEGVQTSGTNIVNASIFKSRRASAYYENQGPRLGYNTLLSVNKLIFDTSNLDRLVSKVRVGLVRPLEGTATVRLNLEAGRIDYRQIDRADDDKRVRLTWGYNPTQNTLLMLGAGWRKRDSTTQVNSFEALSGFISFQYGVGDIPNVYIGDPSQ